MKTLIAVVGLVATTGCFHRTPELPAPIPKIEGGKRVAFALRYTDISIGTGAEVAPKKCIYAHYTGWLMDGKKFDSSRDTTNDGKPRNPISFPQGSRRVIAGWDLGFDGMRVGGRRRLFIPYQLAYGEAGRPPVIPPKAELVFDVELMAVKDTIPTPLTQPSPPQQCAPWSSVSGR